MPSHTVQGQFPTSIAVSFILAMLAVDYHASSCCCPGKELHVNSQILSLRQATSLITTSVELRKRSTTVV
jgi:hypothetical protein